jgi:hypothetical protein
LDVKRLKLANSVNVPEVPCSEEATRENRTNLQTASERPQPPGIIGGQIAAIPAIELDEEATVQVPDDLDTRSLPDDDLRWELLPICHDNLNRLA